MNAGTMYPHCFPYSLKVLQINLTAPFQLSKDFAKHLLSQRKPGRIINVGSIMSFQGLSRVN
jgi:NAD(P)-dependent dehydrogenase (short-subunit alcohol dehydrogenase family)